MTRSDTSLEDDFLEELARKLAEANIPVKRREAVLTEVDELMSEGIQPESFGSPPSRRRSPTPSPDRMTRSARQYGAPTIRSSSPTSKGPPVRSCD